MHRLSGILLAFFTLAALAACRSREGAREDRPDSRQAVQAPAEQPARAIHSDNPLAPYVKRSIPDQFNATVTDEARRNPRPRRGGTLVIRTKAEPKTLNPLLNREHSARLILNQLQDSLLGVDPETLERLPRMAAYWQVRDYVEKRGAEPRERIEGLITTQTQEGVKIVPGASIWTFLVNDIVSSDTRAGVFETRFGHRLHGRPRVLGYTVEITETPATPALTLANDELSTWANVIGDKTEERLSIKRRCVYEFRLRERIRWHDGRPVTMYDLECGFQTMRNDQVDCLHLRNYYLDIEKLEVLDPLTAKYTYRKPYFQALEFCGGLDFLPRHILQPDQHGGCDTEGYADFFNKHTMGHPKKAGDFIGIGPYKFESWTRGRELVVVRNEDYWACRAGLPYRKPDQPYLDRIVRRKIEDRTAALREMENGTVDCDFDVEPETWFQRATNTVEFQSRFVRAKYESPGYTYIGWNHRRALFQDERVRRALTMLIPRERILQTIHRQLARPAPGPFYPGGPCCDPSVQPLPYDPRVAEQLLREAGWIDRDGDGVLDKDGRKFEFEYLIHTAREYHRAIANVIQASVKQAGIKMIIRPLELTVFEKTVYDHNFDAVRYGWTGLLDPDPYQIWHSSQSQGGSNVVSYDNARVDALLERGREEFDAPSRWALFREVHRILHDEQPYTFMFYFDNLVLYHQRFRGVRFYPLDPSTVHYDLSEWYVADE